MILKKITCGITLILACALCQAEVIKIPIGQQNTDSAITLPKHGQTKSAILERFGEPAERTSAIGEPPISHWVYQGFTVYFESNRVIHAVRKFVPKVPSAQQ